MTTRIKKVLSLVCFIFLPLLCVSSLAQEKTKPLDVKLETSKGDIVIRLNTLSTPITTANFLSYLDSGYYDNTVFHRTIPNFMVQGGGFQSGMIKKKTNDPIINESASDLSNVRGSISMARRGTPNSATSQFFINVADNKRLDMRGLTPGYAVFGQVIQGMDVVDAIVQTPTHSTKGFQNVPAEDIYILHATRIAQQK
ncbi:MAG: peptidyl-prolyl cis-trans isomerase A (cyclophilin A) [Flavobacteriales bacterium]|jgi:peptidyl-prolyl cis-trans isomerase A (cyclophilin A)